MAESYIIPEWLKSELPEAELHKLETLAGEHRVKTLAPLAKTLSEVVHKVEAEIKSNGKSELSAELLAAFNGFRSAAFPGETRTAATRTIGASNGKERDSRRDVAIWKNSSAVVEKLGHASLKAAKAAGVDTQAVRAKVIELLDGGNESPADAIDAAAYAPTAVAATA
ncbi:MAG: hypothetical protein ACHQWH_02765 [Nitrososphaerales archaeon]|jgi:hypothetical protein